MVQRSIDAAQLSYGVLVGTVKDGTFDPSGTSPHYEIWVVAGAANFRIAVNVQSVDASEVLVYYDPAYAQETKRNLAALASGPFGFAPLATGSAGGGLDYLRDNLFPIAAMRPVPDDGSGVTLKNLFDGQIERAKADPAAVVIAFGDHFSDPGADASFGFSPEVGVHDIHMMQGNSGSFASDNRINGDGALFIRYGGGETMALFVRFATQSISTDDRGNPVK
jgi:uncharacterized protein YukJ